jgi:GDP-4-dehydro-6-deoxy-D-mannose reductase
VRVLVTGAGGFVGRHLVAALEDEGHAVVGVDREVDVREAGAVDAAVLRGAPEAVVHLAALSFVPDSIREPEAAFRVNFLGTRHVLEAVRRGAPRARVLVVSTGHVYGTALPDAPAFDEGAPLRPGSPYARAKAAADLLAGCYASRGLDVVRVRPFNHTGPGRPDAFVESSLARQLVEIEAGRRTPRLAVGNLDAVRDFLDVRDVVEAYRRLLDPAVPPGLYNLASGVGRSIRALLEALLECVDLGPRGAELSLEVEAERWRPADRAVGDASRLRSATGWEPRVPFAVTLRDLVGGWRAELGAA